MRYLAAIALLLVACGSSAPAPVTPSSSGAKPIGSTPRSMTEGGDCETVDCADAPPCDTVDCVDGAPPGTAKPKSKKPKPLSECSTDNC